MFAYVKRAEHAKFVDLCGHGVSDEVDPIYRNNLHSSLCATAEM